MLSRLHFNPFAHHRPVMFDSRDYITLRVRRSNYRKKYLANFQPAGMKTAVGVDLGDGARRRWIQSPWNDSGIEIDLRQFREDFLIVRTLYHGDAADRRALTDF